MDKPSEYILAWIDMQSSNIYDVIHERHDLIFDMLKSLVSYLDEKWEEEQKEK